MLTEARQDFVIALGRWNGGLSVLPSPPSLPKAHRFQGGLIYSRMVEIEGRVVAPEIFAGRRIRIWLSQLDKWRSGRHGPPNIGDIYDRTGELPGGGLEASVYIPVDTWAPALHCLSTIWRRLSLTGVQGDGRQMRLVDISFSSDSPADA